MDDPAKVFDKAARDLVEVGKNFYQRGWVLSTSGNFSAVFSEDPVCIAITPSGVEKGSMRPEEILAVGADGRTLNGEVRPSAETPLHLMLVRSKSARAVLHTHSVWSTFLSELHASESGLAIEGYEMLKGLSGVKTHKHVEWLPIIENSQEMSNHLELIVERELARHPAAHGFLLQGHGLYTWGTDLKEAKRHVEAFEFLLEVVGRRRMAGVPARQPDLV